MAMKCANCGSDDHMTKDCDMAEKVDDNSGGDKEASKATEDNSGGDKEARKGKKKASGSDSSDDDEKDEDQQEESGESPEEEEEEEEEESKGLGGGSTGKTTAKSGDKSDDGDDDDDGDTSKGYMMKGGSEGDSPSDFAYVPDPEKPSTWKLPIHDAKHAGMAAAALSSGGFRGQKAQIPDAAKAKVKAKVRSAWKKHNPDKKPEDMPEVLKSDTTLAQLAANASALSKRFADAINQGGK